MTASRTAIPAPTYVLIADLSSLVIRPPAIGSRLLNPRSAASVKAEYGYASFFASQFGSGAAFRGMRATRHRLAASVSSQGIQTSSVLCNDGSRGIYRL